MLFDPSPIPFPFPFRFLVQATTVSPTYAEDAMGGGSGALLHISETLCAKYVTLPCFLVQVTTVSPTYAEDAMGGGGGALRETLGRKDVRAKFRVRHQLKRPAALCVGEFI